jgi:CDP-diacylglycerol--serine O-phosphatidyltransferase
MFKKKGLNCKNTLPELQTADCKLPTTYICPMNIRSQIPNLLTLGNLACGSLAIMFLSNLEYLNACVWLIFAAGVFDVLDGLVARALGVSGEMGKQLDSLADLVSFGVFPAVLIFKLFTFYREFYAIGTPWSEKEFDLPIWMPYIGILLILGAAYRLARFNIDPSQSSEFKGLPAPANGLLWTSLFAAILEMDFEKRPMESTNVHAYIWFAAGLVVISALLMVSRIRLFAFKFKDPSWENNKPRWIFIMLIPATVAITYLSTELFFLSVPILLILYVLISILFNYLIPKHEVQSRN